MKIVTVAVIGAASIATAANAGFVGWVARWRDGGTHWVLDIYAGMSAPTDKLLNVYNANITSTNGAAFYQGATAGTNKWRPTLGVANIDDVDSFVTMGGFDDGGVYYCGDTTTADPNFTNYATSNATTIPANAGWFTSDPTSPQVVATSLANQAGVAWTGSALANYGVWVGHFLTIKNEASNSGSGISFSASAAFNTGTNATDSRYFAWNIPAPGALALLGFAGLAPRRRRETTP